MSRYNQSTFKDLQSKELRFKKIKEKKKRHSKGKRRYLVVCPDILELRLYDYTFFELPLRYAMFHNAYVVQLNIFLADLEKAVPPAGLFPIYTGQKNENYQQSTISFFFVFTQF